MSIILATRNPSKAEQIRGIFEALPVEILTLTEAGIEGGAVENGATLFANALKKATYARDHIKGDMRSWVIADDTGLFIPALGGAPGVHSARWAGENAETHDITLFTLEKLKGIVDRRATFETAVVVFAPDGSTHFFEGSLEGWILEEERVPPQPKMPYSGIFLPANGARVLAEMSVEEENLISHRGIAFRMALDFLERCARLRLD
ncbi:MAG: non-canonical purine NTP pyrophosphatase [Patescibacteria group bacterium]